MKTYSLAEVAAQVLPPEWDGERWLKRRIRRGEINAYKVGRTWRMTGIQIEQMVYRYSTASTPVEPVTVADGLSARSRRRLRSA